MARALAAAARRAAGLSLLEVMAVLAILAVLAAVALPIYRGYALRALRTSAQADLLRCAQGMERHAGRTGGYAGAADADGDGVADADTGAIAANVCTVATDAYQLTVVVADARRFVLQATPAAGGGAAGDGTLAIDSVGARRWDRNGDGDFDDAGEDSWRW